MKKMKRTGAIFLILMMLFSFAAAEGTETASFRGMTVSTDTEYLDLGKMGVTEWDPFCKFLHQLPNL